MKLRHIGKKKFIGGALAAGIIMGGGGVAFAYMAGTATGSGNGAVIKAPAAVTLTDPTPSNALTLGGTFVVHFNAHNSNAVTETLTEGSVVATIEPTATHPATIKTNTHSVGTAAGCKVTWFTVTASFPNGNIVPAATGGATGYLTDAVNATIHFNDTATEAQTACLTAHPLATISLTTKAG